MSQPSSEGSSGTLKTGLRWVNYPGYYEAEIYPLAAAVVVPANRRLVVTSGQLGVDETGKHPEEYKDEFRRAFEGVEKSIKAVDPSLSAEEIWHSVYQVTTYHAEGISKEIFEDLIVVSKEFLRGHTPAWSAVEVKSLNMGARFEIVVNAAIP